MTWRAVPPSRAQDAICARVVIQINQQAVITRDAFRATLTLNNGSDVPLEDVSVLLDIRDPGGEAADGVFGVNISLLDNIDAVDGTGTVPACTDSPDCSTGRAVVEWLIIPTDDAALTEDSTPYFVGGELSYTHDGTLITVPLFPQQIDVLPNPQLFVKYFVQSPVYSDNPFSDDVEPAEPFTLGLMMSNAGLGTARNVRISTSQPQIIRNDRQLLIAFRIIAAQVGLLPVSPNLTVDLGDIGPDQTAVARWLLTSTLQGHFICYQAVFEHVDALDDPRLSLVEAVDIFELNHTVLVDVPDDDGLPDFLVNDPPSDDQTGCDKIPPPGGPREAGARRPGEGNGRFGSAGSAAPGSPQGVPDDLPDVVHVSDGSLLPVNTVLTGSFDGAPTLEDLSVELTVDLPAGWTYVRLDDPGGNEFRLVQAVRGDGRILPVGDVGNAWTTHRWGPFDGPPAYREDRLHLFDYLDAPATVTYTLTYGPPLTLDAFVISGGLTQRSNVADLAVRFTAPTNIPLLMDNGQIAQAVTLWNRSGAQVQLDPARYAWDAPANTLTLDLTGDGYGGGQTTLLADGNYDLRLDTLQVQSDIGAYLPDEDGTPDGVFHFGDDAGDGLFRFAGDATGDRTVNFLDLQLVRNSWLLQEGDPGFDPNADLNGDGVVNESDEQLVRSNWLGQLPF